MRLFRLNVSGHSYFLSMQNMELDAPNVFTEHFNTHKNAKSMNVDRDWLSFRYIQKYLQGYDVLERLNEHQLEDLLADAIAFKLGGLEAKIKETFCCCSCGGSRSTSSGDSGDSDTVVGSPAPAYESNVQLRTSNEFTLGDSMVTVTILEDLENLETNV